MSPIPRTPFHANISIDGVNDLSSGYQEHRRTRIVRLLVMWGLAHENRPGNPNNPGKFDMIRTADIVISSSECNRAESMKNESRSSVNT